MKISIRIQMFVLMLALGSLSVARGQQKLSGSYTMTIASQIVAQEKFTLLLDPSGSLEAEADVESGVNKIHTVTKATKTGPKSFSFTVPNQAGSTVIFNGNTAKISTTGQPDREVNTQANVVLENGLWHQLVFLLKQYDAGRAGSQSFIAFLPSQASELKIQLERTESPTVDVKGNHVATEHYRATTSQGLTIDLWTDNDRVPLVISVPTQNVKVVRTGSEELAELLVPKPKPSAKVNNFTSEEVNFTNGDVRLAGTLTLPKTGKAPFPAAVIISGSGGQDRDGTTGVFNLYKLLAESFSNAGAAVLRADDRGVAKRVKSDPSVLARQVKCPVFIMNGERDALVLTHNAIELGQALIAGGNKQVRLRIFPNLTHSFTSARVDRTEAADQFINVSAEVLQTVSEWASKTLSSKSP